MIHPLSLSENHRFRALYSRGKSRVGRYMVAYSLKNRSADCDRLGLTVSKKLGKAVTRNRIRRRLREAYRLIEPSVRLGYDIVIVARHGSETAPFAALQDEMLRLLRELGVTEERKHG